MYTLFILYIVIHYCVSQEPDDLVFNRVRILKNTAKQSSIRLHAYSPELSTLHAILRFSSPVNTQHNTLFIQENSLVKYRKVLQEETQKMTISSRGKKRMLSYLMLRSNESNDDIDADSYSDRLEELIESVRFLGLVGHSGVGYDGVFLMDAYSAIWNEYNLAIFTEHLLTFRYRVNGTLTPIDAPEVKDYSGSIRLPCQQNIDSDNCLVLHQPIVVNGHSFPTYRLVIDFDSPRNLLPIDLYLMWQNNESFSTLSIQLDREQWLHLNQHFQYELHQSNIILLGIDVIHHFPRVEYSVAERALQLWYHHDQVFHHARHETIKILFVFFNFLLEVALFIWATTYNYLILNYIIEFACYARLTHFFAHKQILCELVVMLVSLIVIIISLAVPQPGVGYHVRKEIFIGFLSYYWLTNLFMLILSSKALLCSLRHYFPRQCHYVEVLYRKYRRRLQSRRQLEEIVYMPPTCFDQSACTALALPYGELFADLCDRERAELLHKTVVATYHDPLIKMPTSLAIVHNLLFIGNLLFTLALLFNFYTPLNNVYLLFIVLISLGLIYFQVKYIAIGILYLSLFQQSKKQRNGWLIAFLVLESLVVLLHIIFSYDHIFLAYFNTINSTHSLISIHAAIKTLIGIMILMALLIVLTAFDKYADPLIECAIEQRRKRGRIAFIQ